MAVTGAGDPALEAAVYLKSLASKLYVIHRTDKMMGDDETLNVLRNSPNVQFVGNSRVKAIKGTDHLAGIVLEDVNDKRERDLATDALFVEMGYVAKTELVKDLVQLNGIKEIVTDKEGKTSHPGIFAAGDVTDTPYKQAVISAGQGSAAGLSAYNYVQRLKGGPALKVDWKAKH